MIEEIGTTIDGDIIINVGPQHPATHGVLHLVITINGETIKKVEARRPEIEAKYNEAVHKFVKFSATEVSKLQKRIEKLEGQLKVKGTVAPKAAAKTVAKPVAKKKAKSRVRNRAKAVVAATPSTPAV